MKLVFSLAIILLFVVPLWAQEGAVDIRGKVSREGLFDPFTIAVEDLNIEGIASSPDSTVAHNIAQIIRNNLTFHVAFQYVALDSFLLEVLELDQMTRRAWNFMGADYLVTGNVSFGADDVSIRYQVWDLKRDAELTSDGMKTKRSNYRRLAHAVSDAVVEHVAGMKPIFNTRMAYVSARSGNKEIYMSDFDGFGEYALTSNGSINLSPAWSPDGKAIYYTSYKDGAPHLWAVNLDSGKHVKVSSYKGINSAAAIAPNSDEICLTLTKDGNAELYLLDLSGNIKHRLTRTSAIESSPSFGPGGYTIAFSSDRTGTPQVYVMDRDGLNVERVTYQGNYNDSPSLSPDGTKIAFVTRGTRGSFDICVVDVTGEHFEVITRRGSNENPHWAPDGFHLVFARRTGDSYDVYISDFKGITERRISSDSQSTNPYWSPVMR